MRWIMPLARWRRRPRAGALVESFICRWLHFALRRLALRRNDVDFVDEQQAGRALLRLLKQRADFRLALAREARDNFRRRDGEKRHIELARNGRRQKRLAAAGGAV